MQCVDWPKVHACSGADRLSSHSFRRGLQTLTVAVRVVVDYLMSYMTRTCRVMYTSVFTAAVTSRCSRYDV